MRTIIDSFQQRVNSSRVILSQKIVLIIHIYIFAIFFL